MPEIIPPRFYGEINYPARRQIPPGHELKSLDFKGNFCRADEEIVQFVSTAPFVFTWFSHRSHVGSSPAAQTRKLGNLTFRFVD